MLNDLLPLVLPSLLSQLESMIPEPPEVPTRTQEVVLQIAQEIQENLTRNQQNNQSQTLGLSTLSPLVFKFLAGLTDTQIYNLAQIMEDYIIRIKREYVACQIQQAQDVPEE